ncbi:hypothetical protein CPB83DRAFT_832385 [Crepidotus variabilis]|uniref:Uncharacterized protein n=1 Tax=Crepidotus variabilis TaxID=179855 RepID=A0A9P6JU98_9AGAR|nr:hypothetical protein CPB83DRAFT_832385 [Crepidotus variabilis]
MDYALLPFHGHGFIAICGVGQTRRERLSLIIRSRFAINIHHSSLDGLVDTNTAELMALVMESAESSKFVNVDEMGTNPDTELRPHTVTVKREGHLNWERLAGMEEVQGGTESSSPKDQVDEPGPPLVPVILHHGEGDESLDDGESSVTKFVDHKENFREARAAT